jgi:hypothetical protein
MANTVELMLEKKMPDGIVANIMKCLGCMNSSFDAGVYAKHEEELKDCAKYVKNNNWSLSFQRSDWGSGGWEYLFIKIDESMIKQLIKDEISVQYTYIVEGVINVRGVSNIVEEREGYICFDGSEEQWMKINDFKRLELEKRFNRTYE